MQIKTLIKISHLVVMADLVIGHAEFLELLLQRYTMKVENYS